MYGTPYVTSVAIHYSVTERRKNNPKPYIIHPRLGGSYTSTLGDVKCNLTKKADDLQTP
jgi:hypothetical protein